MKRTHEWKQKGKRDCKRLAGKGLDYYALLQTTLLQQQNDVHGQVSTVRHQEPWSSDSSSVDGAELHDAKYDILSGDSDGRRGHRNEPLIRNGVVDPYKLATKFLYDVSTGTPSPYEQVKSSIAGALAKRTALDVDESLANAAKFHGTIMENLFLSQAGERAWINREFDRLNAQKQHVQADPQVHRESDTISFFDLQRCQQNRSLFNVTFFDNTEFNLIDSISRKVAESATGQETDVLIREITLSVVHKILDGKAEIPALTGSDHPSSELIYIGDSLFDAFIQLFITGLNIDKMQASKQFVGEEKARVRQLVTSTISNYLERKRKEYNRIQGSSNAARKLAAQLREPRIKSEQLPQT